MPPALAGCLGVEVVMSLPRSLSESFVADCMRIAVRNNGYGVPLDVWEYIVYYRLLAKDGDGRYYATERGRELLVRNPEWPRDDWPSFSPAA
jgi:hypothetical protein